jgi:hypothetical protein
MKRTEAQWRRALWQSYGIQDWISPEVAEKAVCDNLAAGFGFNDFDIKKDRLAPVIVDEVVKAGVASDLESEMLPRQLRDTLKRDAYETPAFKVRGRIKSRRSEWYAGNENSQIAIDTDLDLAIGQLIERLRQRLLFRPLPDDEALG